MFKIISVKEVFGYGRNEDFIFIDLRSREEFEKEHIKKAFCMSLAQIETEDYFLAKEYSYILYCNHGGVSMQAAALMADAEVPVYTLAGGMEEYKIFMRSLVDRKRAKL